MSGITLAALVPLGREPQARALLDRMDATIAAQRKRIADAGHPGETVARA
jgi:ABC-type Fe3+-hydroxamate transport system substrate-binding protein